MSIGIGFLGSGPVTQAIHLPVLSTLGDRFHVARVMDINPVVAQAVAGRCGAQASTSAEAIYDDPAVEIVAICSPNEFHAEQVIASCRAGKKAILCEKPLAVSTHQAEDIARVAAETGTPILVGTMHAFDPAYRAAAAAWRQTGDSARLVQSSIFLPTNDVFINQATEQVPVPQNGPPSGFDPAAPEIQKRMFRAAMLGLAIHNIPLIREYFPSAGTVQEARYVTPFGYRAVSTSGRQALSLQALMPGNWPAKWELRIIGENHDLSIAFPPSYVIAGSSRAHLRGPHGTQVFEQDQNGYEALWLHLHDVVHGKAEPIISLDTAAGDLGFALDLAAQADAIFESAH